MRIQVRISLLISTVALTICTTLTAAQDKPNFSGTWKLDPAKSDFGGMPAYSAIIRIDHKEPSITSTYKVRIGDREIEETITFKTDGTETKNRTLDAELTYKAQWEGTVLTREAEGKTSNGSPLARHDRWVLSKNGKVLTMSRHSTTDNWEGDVRFVLEKQ
jgi:hypothetical protein